MSNNDGCVISRSPECKVLGIERGTPYFKLKNTELVFRSSHDELYGDMSARIAAMLGTFTPDVEQYSIDKAFLHFSGEAPAKWAGSWEALGRLIRERVLRWTGIPCGVGFAPTRTLAKIANHIGKKRPVFLAIGKTFPCSVFSRLFPFRFHPGNLFFCNRTHPIPPFLFRHPIRPRRTLSMPAPGLDSPPPLPYFFPMNRSTSCQEQCP